MIRPIFALWSLTLFINKKKRDNKYIGSIKWDWGMISNYYFPLYQIFLKFESKIQDYFASYLFGFSDYIIFFNFISLWRFYWLQIMWLLYKKVGNLLIIFSPFLHLEIMGEFVKFYYFQKIRKSLYQLIRICGGYILQTIFFLQNATLKPK